MRTLRDDIESAINRFSAENESNTPDYVLSQFIVNALSAFNVATNARTLHLAGRTKATTPPEVTQAMVDRFLTWRLPADFAPDSGIAFEGRNRDPRGHQWPTGTNLLHAGQARAMLEHVLGAPYTNIAPSDDGTDGAVALCQHLDRVGRTSSERIITINGGTFIVKAELVHREPEPDTRPKSAETSTTTGETAADKQTAHQFTASEKESFFNPKLGVPYADPLEAEIQAKGPTAPRVTPADVGAAIVSEHYFTAENGVRGATYGGDGGPAGLGFLAFCVLILRNGTKIVGVNYGAIDPAQHDAERGRKDAREDAIRQVWPLLGYALRERMAQGGAA